MLKYGCIVLPRLANVRVASRDTTLRDQSANPVAAEPAREELRVRGV